MLLNVNVLGQEERRNSESLIGPKRDGLAPILDLFHPVRRVWAVHLFAGERQFGGHEFPLHTMQDGWRFPVVRDFEMHKMSGMRVVVAEVYLSDVRWKYVRPFQDDERFFERVGG